MTGPVATTPRRRGPVSKREREAFLAVLGQGFSVTRAAAEAGRSRQRFYEMRDRDERFRDAWAEAWEAGNDLLEDEIRRRAVDGWDEPIYQRGELVGTVRKYSDRLLELAARARIPQRYRESSRVELTGRDGAPVEIAANRPPATLADLMELAGRLGVLDRLGYRQIDDGEVVDGDAVELPGDAS